MKKLVFVILVFLVISKHNALALELPNYIIAKKAENAFSKKHYREADSLYSAINTKQYNELVDYNRGIVALSQNKFWEALQYFNNVVSSKKISPKFKEYVYFNIYKLYSDSALKLFGSGEDGTTLYKQAIFGFDSLYKHATDSIVKHRSLQELYRLSNIPLPKSKNKNKSNEDKKNNNKNQKKNNDKQKNQNKNNQENKNSSEQPQQPKQEENKKKTADEQMYQLILNNVKDSKKKIVKEELKGLKTKGGVTW